MKKLFSMTRNIFYVKEENEKTKEIVEEKMFEIVLLIDVPFYSINNESKLLRERKIEEMRFIASQEQLEDLAKSLLSIINKVTFEAGEK